MATDSEPRDDPALPPLASPDRRPMMWALGLWALLALAVGVKTMVTPDLHSVFPKLSIRALDWWLGQPMYAEHENLGGFPYTPTFAISLTPFAVLGNRFGGVLWSWVSMAVYLLGLRRCVRDVLPGKWPPAHEAAFLMLAMIGALRGIWNAQSNALIIGLLMLAASAITRRRWWSAAILLAAPFFIKMWTIAIALLFVVLWLRPLGWRFVLVIVIGAAFPFLTQSFDTVVEQHRGWVTYLRSLAAAEIGSYHDLGTLLRRFHAPVSKGLYRAIQAAAAGATLAWCLWWQRHALDTRWLLTGTLAMGAAWAMVFGPGIEYNTYVVLAPAVSWAVLRAFVTGRGRILACAAFAMTNVFGIGAIERILERLFVGAHFMMPAGTLLFVAWLILYACRNSNEPRALARAGI